jgi:HlyD family secretion protein
MTKRAWVALGLAGAIGLGAAAAAAWKGLLPAAAWLPVIGAEAEETPLALFGNVERREVSLAFNVAGRVAGMPAEEGDRVAAGDVLARLERDRFRHEVAAAEARVAGRRARLDELERGTRAEEIEQARARVASAEARLETARREFARIETLAGDDFASQRRLDEVRAARDEAEAALKVARADLAVAVEGPRREAIRAARADLAAAEAELALARERLEDSALTAPFDGIVRSRVVEPGAVVDAARPVYLLARTEPLEVRAYVAEPDLGRIAPGMAVEVVSDGRPDRPHAGRIGFISPTAEFTPKTVYTPEVRASLVYRLRVVVEGAGEGLRQGMPVTVRVPRAGGG